MPETPPPQQADIGVTGLAVMGANLARNLARHGYVTAVHNRTRSRTHEFLTHHGTEGPFVACEHLGDLVTALARPRKVIIMVQAGPATDAVIDELTGLLEPSDVLVDGRNAHFQDTRRREQTLAGHGIHFVGCGISGGEEGALLGPSIMTGGSRQAYRLLGPFLERIAARVDGHLLRPCRRRRGRALRQDGAQRHRVPPC
jgi:6-phosphogluconate dehydrogenase